MEKIVTTLGLKFNRHCWMLTPRTEKRQKVPFLHSLKRRGRAVTDRHSEQLTDETEGGSYGGKWGCELGLLVRFSAGRSRSIFVSKGKQR